MRTLSNIDSRTVSTALVVGGIGLFVLTMAVSAALAPEVTVEPDSVAGNQTIVGIQGGGPGWHQYGSVVLRNGTAVTWREASADSYFDVTQLDNGSYIAAFMSDAYRDCGEYDSPCSRTGYRVIDPTPQPHVVAEYSFPVRTKKDSEVHAAEQLPSGAVIMTDMDRERVFTVSNGEVTWQWNASSFYEAPGHPTGRDWLHINDVDVIGEDRYLVSVRNANQLVIIERGEGVVEVINRDRTAANDENCRGSGQLVDADGDGDVRCGDPQVLNHQHNPQWLGDGAVLVADSENDRVVELHRTANGTWEPVWTLESVGGIPFNWPRDADRLPNGNTLITDTLNKRIVEVDESGEVVTSWSTEKIPYEADRLPQGELLGAPTMNATPGGDTNTPPSDIPGVSLLLVGLRAIFPALPFWYTEPQAVSTLVSLGLVVAGGVYRLRS